MEIEIDNPDGARQIMQMWPDMQRRERACKRIDWMVGVLVVSVIGVNVWAAGPISTVMAAVLGATLSTHIWHAVRRRENWLVLCASMETLGMALSWTGDEDGS